MLRYAAVGGVIAFVLFQLFGRGFFPRPPGPEFVFSWAEATGAAIVTVIGSFIGLAIGGLLAKSKSDG